MTETQSASLNRYCVEAKLSSTLPLPPQRRRNIQIVRYERSLTFPRNLRPFAGCFLSVSSSVFCTCHLLAAGLRGSGGLRQSEHRSSSPTSGLSPCPETNVPCGTDE